jgi:hypothetical protein
VALQIAAQHGTIRLLATFIVPGENDSECLARTGVNAPWTMFPGSGPMRIRFPRSRPPESLPPGASTSRLLLTQADRLTLSWRQAFTCDISGLSWSRSVGTQLASDAMGQLGVAGKLVGEGIRISFLGPTVPLPNGISACAIDGALHSFTAAIVTVLGITATLVVAPLSGIWRVYALLVSSVLIGVMVLATVGVASRWPLVGSAARAIGRLPFLHNWVSSKQSIIDSAENNLLTFHRQAPAAFWANLTLNALWHALAVLEVFAILRFMGARIAPIAAFVAEGMTKVINLVGALNPGNLGTYEAGNMLIAKMFGVTGTAGLTLALCRRARAVFWAGVGVTCMVAMKRTDWRTRRTATRA